MARGIHSINQTVLARHLAVDCSTLPRIVSDLGLQAVAGQFPWRRVLRLIHRTEAARLPGHLTTLRKRHASPILDTITDLETELRASLLRFDAMADLLGVNPGTLSRALREGRRALPITELRFGPRLRRYRPLEVLLWRDEGVLLDLPPATALADPARLSLASSAARTSPCSPAHAAEAAGKALFGVFARDSRTLAG